MSDGCAFSFRGPFGVGLKGNQQAYKFAGVRRAPHCLFLTMLALVAYLSILQPLRRDAAISHTPNLSEAVAPALGEARSLLEPFA